MTVYRISWRSLHTDATGHGDFLFQNLSELEQIVRDLNRTHCYDILHWIEWRNDEGLLECIQVSDRTDQQVGARCEQCGAGAVRAVNNREACQTTR